jgi:hypothetical protein
MTDTIDKSTLKLFWEPKDRLRLTVGEDRSYPTVKAAWASPMSYPNRYLCLLNGKGEEIVMLETVEELPPDSRQAALEELALRYLTATVVTILDARNEFGATYWHVTTDRGERDFVTQSLQENAQWLSPTHLMLMDVDGNRFELKDVTAMDRRSMTLLEAIL